MFPAKAFRPAEVTGRCTKDILIHKFPVEKPSLETSNFRLYRLGSEKSYVSRIMLFYI